jgi:GNAT superfamily N-acetyltransferase
MNPRPIYYSVEVKAIPAQKQDSDEVIALVAEVWSEYGCTLLIDIEERHLLNPGAYFRALGGDFWVVRENGRLIATSGLKIESGVAEMKTLYVKKEFRGKGLGTFLTDLAIETARNRGASVMELWSDTRFHDAHRMYERLGFARFSERKLNDHNNTREYGYRREI